MNLVKVLSHCQNMHHMGHVAYFGYIALNYSMPLSLIAGGLLSLICVEKAIEKGMEYAQRKHGFHEVHGSTAKNDPYWGN